jgi:prepilin-type N-terminal cleavage/methylation domain-containing protein
MKISNFIKSQKAFTLIELLVVVAVIGMMSVIGVASFISYNKNQTLQQAVSDFVNTLNTAKSKAYSQTKTSSCSGSLDGYSVRIVNNSYSLYIVCSGVSSQLTTPPVLANITIAPNENIFFQVITGGVTGNGNVVFTQVGGNSKTVKISSVGVITAQ